MLCFAFGCDHKSHNGTCKFKMFPSDAKVFKKWEELCRRQDSQATSQSALCSCHFEGGDFSTTPNIFMWSKHKFTSPEKRTRKRKAPRTKSCDDEKASGMEAKAEESEQLMKQIEQLQHRVNQLEMEKESLKFTSVPMSYQQAKVATYKKVSYVYYYTGLQPEVYEQLLLWLIRFDVNYVQGWEVIAVSKEDQIFLTFMKLRCNFEFSDLAFRFKISDRTVSNIFYTWLKVLHTTLFPTIQMPSTSKNKLSLPSSFIKYTSCRVVVDCTEIEGQVPRQSMDESARLFSGYKKRHTFKYLVGCAPNGAITFVSEAYPGGTSDKIIFDRCGINSLLVQGDMVLVDKGFLINDIVPCGVAVNMPHFLMDKQFTPSQVNHNYEIANARIIIERVNSRIKNFYIVDSFPKFMRSHATMVFQTVCCLVNLQNPLIADIPGRNSEGC